MQNGCQSGIAAFDSAILVILAVNRDYTAIDFVDSNLLSLVNNSSRTNGITWVWVGNY